MAKKKMSKQQTRKMRTQQIIFAIIAIIMIASFIVSMIA
jgi:predicted nucleic acid-binding Zn ribbon protein